VGFFADASQAMRAPTAIELACANPAQPCALPTGFVGDPNLAPVVAHTLELGARGALGQHVTWNMAAYRTVLDNDIEFIFTPAGLGYFANVGQTQRRGFEAGVSADFTHWHLSASYGTVAATYRSSFTDANGDTVVPGDHLAGIPGQSVKLHAGFTPSKEAEFGASLIATSGQWAHGDEANLNPEVPGYMLVNIDAHLHPMPRVEVFGSVNNLLDRRYATFGVMGQNIYTGAAEQFRTPAPGRSVMLGLRYGFGKKASTPQDD
jgi:outer membrane receptor protein involved in Fe transport